MSNELLSSDALIDWLRNQPPEEEYTWSDPVFCLMGKYITDVGTPADLYAYGEMPHYHEIAETKSHTYGAALQRAEKLKQLPSSASFEAPIQEKSRDLVTVDGG